MDPLTHLLTKHGPRRSSRLSEMLQAEFGATPEAARKRLSRAKPPVRSFPFSLLPKREAFIYLEDDRGTERYWTNFHDALREADSVYGAAIDGVIARGGIVSADEFPVISGAPNQQRKHVPASMVLDRLCQAGFLRTRHIIDLGDVVELAREEIGHVDRAGYPLRQAVEGVILDGVREWARKLGLASYNSIAIRGENHPRLIGPYKWDLTGPSYLLPLREGKDSPHGQGFLAADAFAGEMLDPHQIRYIIRKAAGLRATTRVGRVLPLIIAHGFTGEALTAGHKAGLVMATPASLFGKRVGRALLDLLATLSKAADVVAANPDRLAGMIEDLSDIEGAAGNLRGILFELMVAYLVRQDGGSIDMGRKAYDPETGDEADIDILLVKGKDRCVAYECKGKNPDGRVTLEEVEDWLRRLPTFRKYIRNGRSLSEAHIVFELWTSGDFEPDALAKLQHEKRVRARTPIDWKNGEQVREFSKGLKETRVTRAFDEHFFKHPVTRWADSRAGSQSTGSPRSSSRHRKPNHDDVDLSSAPTTAHARAPATER
jgi:hypothetical protein